MKIGLIDVDGHNFPNIPLMKLSAWHKAQGDQVEWYNPLWSGHMDKVYMSKVFSFTDDYPYFIDADEVQKGGSGYCISLVDGKEVYDSSKDVSLPYEIEHIYPDYSIYPEETKDTAYGFLTRGCPRGCSFCHVKAKEGSASRKVADLDEFWNGQKNIILCDPNILACGHRIDLLWQLIDSKAYVDFNQGLDLRMINAPTAELLKKIKIKKLHFAYDRWQDREIIEEKARMLKEITGWDKNHGAVKVFILCNYDTTIEQDLERIEFCRKLKWSPYPMIYDKEHADPIYSKIQRWCNDFIFWRTPTFEQYKRR